MPRTAPFKWHPGKPLPYRIELKEIHGQLFPVKVYATPTYESLDRGTPVRAPRVARPEVKR